MILQATEAITAAAKQTNDVSTAILGISPETAVGTLLLVLFFFLTIFVAAFFYSQWRYREDVKTITKENQVALGQMATGNQQALNNVAVTLDRMSGAIDKHSETVKELKTILVIIANGGKLTNL